MDSTLYQAPLIALSNCGRPTKETPDSSFINDSNINFSTAPRELVACSSTALVKEISRVTDVRRALRHMCIYCLELFLSIKVFEKVMWSFYHDFYSSTHFRYTNTTSSTTTCMHPMTSSSGLPREGLKDEESIIIALSCFSPRLLTSEHCRLQLKTAFE